MTRIQAWIAVIITAVWATTWLIALYRNDYSGAVALTPIMLLVVGFLFGREALRAAFERRNGGKGDH